MNVLLLCQLDLKRECADTAMVGKITNILLKLNYEGKIVL